MTIDSQNLLESILESLTKSKIKAVLLGAGVTAIIQSSSATTVMVVGFVNSGIMRLSQAAGVIMGANIGTTVTSWILSLTGLQGDSLLLTLCKPATFTPVLAFIGVCLLLFAKGDKKHDAGSIMIGFAVLMTGMEMMSGAVKPLANVPEFTNILLMFTNPILGVIAGMRRGKWFDSTILVVSLLLISVPTFVLGFVLQYVLGVQLAILPTTASASVDLRSLTMPAMVLGGVSLAYVIRLTRQSVSENVSADYVRTARAKGLSGGVVMTRHILRNSLIPVATFIGGDLGALMGGAIITEGIFNIHGVGGTLWSAIIKGEPQTVVSVTTVLVLVYIIANLIVDLLYAVLDPRIRYE